MRAHDSAKTSPARTGSAKTGSAKTGSGRTPDAARDRAPAARVTSAPSSRYPGAADEMDPASALALQRAAGNAVVSRMLADREPVQRSAVHDVLRGGGRPFAGPLKEEMEARLGADFSGVRIHTGAAAKASAAEIGARAYTSGNHVVLGDGGADKHTLAHELTHVIQQSQGPVAGTDNGQGLRMSDPSDRFEREAEANAVRVLSAPPTVQRVAAGARPYDGAAGNAPVQRATWDVENAVQPGADEFGGSLEDSDAEHLADAAKRISSAVRDAKGSKKKVLLYLGVGTGNPPSNWGNPTAGPQGGIKEDEQRSPGFLADARGKGYFVIAANFNTGPKGVSEKKGESGLYLDVPARFPLTDAAKKDEKVAKAMADLESAVQAADRFAVMNAVSNVDYQSLLKISQARKSSAYLKSYMQTGETQVRNMASKKKDLVNKDKGNKFSTLDDVFADPDE